MNKITQNMKIDEHPQVEAEMSQLGGDTSHARTFGRLDAALGEHPMRFVNGPDELRRAYIDGYHTTLGKLETTCTPKAKFRNEFPWHKSNGTIDQINKAALWE